MHLSAAPSEVFKVLLDQLRNEVRRKRYSIRNEQDQKDRIEVQRFRL